MRTACCASALFLMSRCSRPCGLFTNSGAPRHPDADADMTARRAPGGAASARVASSLPASIPLLGDRHDAVMAWRGVEPVHVSQFLAELALVAEILPERRYLVNLCRDRYRFAVGLSAALLRGQVSLLPPAHTPELLRALKS